MIYDSLMKKMSTDMGMTTMMMTGMTTITMMTGMMTTIMMMTITSMTTIRDVLTEEIKRAEKAARK